MKKSKIAIGIDIGGTNICYGPVTEEGEVLFRKSMACKSFEEVSVFVDVVSEQLKKYFEEVKSKYDVMGVGIGAPNGNYYNGSIEFAPNLPWKGMIPLADMFAEKLNLPVRLTNDANAAAMGEMIYGDAKGLNDFVMVTLGTGLGSGFVANGKMILGHDGFAGELGHAIYEPDGRQCNCGRKGCFETYCSASGIVRTVKQFLSESGEASLLREIQADDISSADIYNVAVKGDKLALKAFDYTAHILGFMLSNMVAITSPKVIFLFGGLANAKEFILEPTKKYMEENLLHIYKNKVEIKPSALPENNAAILGAAALVWEEN